MYKADYSNDKHFFFIIAKRHLVTAIEDAARTRASSLTMPFLGVASLDHRDCKKIITRQCRLVLRGVLVVLPNTREVLF